MPLYYKLGPRGTSKHMYSSSIVITLFFLLVILQVQVKAQEPFFSFNLDRFVPNEADLIFQVHAAVSPGGVLELTKKKNGVPEKASAGQVLYSAPLQIWDSKTNRATSFVTHLTFLIKAPTNDTADGLAFFIAPLDSQAPLGSAAGLLALFGRGRTNSRIVAVEFDTNYDADWDPPGPHHIGIDVNSIESVKIVPWDMKNGEVPNVVITYFADTNYLRVTLIYGKSQVAHELGHFIDLKTVLPEWVRVGLFATVGIYYRESHDVLSWSFHAFRPSSGTTKTPRDAILHFLQKHHSMAVPKHSSY